MHLMLVPAPLFLLMVPMEWQSPLQSTHVEMEAQRGKGCLPAALLGQSFLCGFQLPKQEWGLF